MFLRRSALRCLCSSASTAAQPPPSTTLLSTERLHSGSAPEPWVGPYASHRASLDYAWHGHYTAARQRLQDGVISSYLSSLPPAPCFTTRPWLVHTAGAMGAGKSHALRSLAASHAFPLRCFVRIDPDDIKTALPEAAAFVAADRATAGTRLHKESLLIADVLTRAAMALGRNVLVDGSMRNTLWYASEWARLKATAPHYRLAVLLVAAPPALIHQRAARRAGHTGREIPWDVIEDSIAQAPVTFNLLRPLADYAAVIDNAGSGPVIQPPDTAQSFAEVWGLQ